MKKTVASVFVFVVFLFTKETFGMSRFPYSHSDLSFSDDSVNAINDLVRKCFVFSSEETSVSHSGFDNHQRRLHSITKHQRIFARKIVALTGDVAHAVRGLGFPQERHSEKNDMEVLIQKILATVNELQNDGFDMLAMSSLMFDKACHLMKRLKEVQFILYPLFPERFATVFRKINVLEMELDEDFPIIRSGDKISLLPIHSLKYMQISGDENKILQTDFELASSSIAQVSLVVAKQDDPDQSIAYHDDVNISYEHSDKPFKAPEVVYLSNTVNKCTRNCHGSNLSLKTMPSADDLTTRWKIVHAERASENRELRIGDRFLLKAEGFNCQNCEENHDWSSEIVAPKYLTHEYGANDRIITKANPNGIQSVFIVYNDEGNVRFMNN